MTRRKTTTAKTSTKRYGVLRSFAQGEIYFTNDNADEIGKLPAKVIKDRIDRGYIAELPEASASPVSADSAKE